MRAETGAQVKGKEIAKKQIGIVAGKHNLRGQIPLHPPPPPELLYLVSDPQAEGIGPITVAGKKNPVARLGVLQGGGQQHHGQQ